MKTQRLAAVLGLALSLGWAGPSFAGSTNGSAGDMPAFYDCQPLTINLKELPPNAERSVLAQNKSINHIYMSDQAMAEGVDFVSVLDAIQGEGPGFNPLWQEVQVIFPSGTTPFQLCSDDAVLNAAAQGRIMLSDTTEVYRCSVVGPK